MTVRLLYLCHVTPRYLGHPVQIVWRRKAQLITYAPLE